jgi:Bacterial DNA-binding protein
MNKSELIDQIAASAEISKAAAGRALDAAVAAVKAALNDGDSVSLIGFGTRAALILRVLPVRGLRPGAEVPRRQGPERPLELIRCAAYGAPREGTIGRSGA